MWEKYLELARDLAHQDPALATNREAKYRSAISRAYYAAFHKAREYLIFCRLKHQLALPSCYAFFAELQLILSEAWTFVVIRGR